MPRTFDHSLETTLIALVEHHPCLYDSDDLNYNNLQKKEEIWLEIASQVHCSVSSCKTAWNTMRDSLRRVLKKRAQWYAVGANVPCKKYRHEDQMSFLLPHFKDLSRGSVHANAKSCDSDELFEETVEVVMSNDDTDSNGRRKRKLEESEDLDSFFACMATTVKRFPLKQRVLAKQRVFKVISEMELQILDEDSVSDPFYFKQDVTD